MLKNTRNILALVVSVVLVGGVGVVEGALIHGDMESGYTYIDLTDDGASNGEWAEDIKTFQVFEPLPHAVGENSPVLRTDLSGLSYFDSVTGQNVASSKNTAMLTMYEGSINSWMEVIYDDSKGYLFGRIWGTLDMDGVVPDYGLLCEDTNEDGTYAYYGSSGTLYTGLFGDEVFSSTNDNFFVVGVSAELDDFFPAYDYYASGSIIVSDFAYGVPEPATMVMLAVGGLVMLRRRRVVSL